MSASESPKDIDTLSFEQAQAELESIVERLEDQQTGLDEAISLWERGEALHAYCQKKLDYAAERIEKLTVDAREAAAVTAEGPDDFQANAGSVAPAAEPADKAAPAPVGAPNGRATADVPTGDEEPRMF